MAYRAGPALSNATLTLHLELQPTPDMIEVQCFMQDPTTRRWFMGRAEGEDTEIWPFTPEGRIDGKPMTWVGGGHGSDLDALPGERIIGNFNGGGPDVCVVKFRPGRVAKSEARRLNLFTTNYAVPAVDHGNDLIAVRTTRKDDSEWYSVRRLSDVLAGKDDLLGQFGGWDRDAETFQGLAVCGTSVYRLTGKTNARMEFATGRLNRHLIHRYDWTTGREVDRLDITGKGARPGDSRLMSEEPEGIAVTDAGLLVGVKRGSGAARRYRLFTVASPNDSGDPDPPMTYTSHNGYTAAKSPSGIPHGVVTITPKGAPDSQFRVRGGDVATVFQYLVDQYQARVEDIDLYTKGSGDDWGYTFRMVRGSSDRLSNHASATAIDINATRHPLGTDPTANFTARQIRAIREIMRELSGAVEWGGDWTGRKDGMHYEISCSTRHLRVVANNIRAGHIGPEAKADKPAKRPGKVTIGGKEMDDIDAVSVHWVNVARSNGKVSRHVYYLQLWLNKAGAALTPDGHFGPATQAALDTFRRGLGLKGKDAEGTLGFESLSKLRAVAKTPKAIKGGK